MSYEPIDIARFDGQVEDAPDGAMPAGTALVGRNYRLSRPGAGGQRSLMALFGARRVFASSLRDLSSTASTCLLWRVEASDIQRRYGDLIVGIDHGRGGAGALLALSREQSADAAFAVRVTPKDSRCVLAEAYGVAAKLDLDNDEIDSLTSSAFPDNTYPARLLFGATAAEVDSARSLIAALPYEAASAVMSATPASIDFGVCQAGDTEDITIANSGGVLDGSGSLATGTYFEIASGSPYSVAHGDYTTLTIRTVFPWGFASGTYTDTLTLTGGGGASIALSMTIA